MKKEERLCKSQNDDHESKIVLQERDRVYSVFLERKRYDVDYIEKLMEKLHTLNNVDVQRYYDAVKDLKDTETLYHSKKKHCKDMEQSLCNDINTILKTMPIGQRLDEEDQDFETLVLYSEWGEMELADRLEEERRELYDLQEGYVDIHKLLESA